MPESVASSPTDASKPCNRDCAGCFPQFYSAVRPTRQSFGEAVIANHKAQAKAAKLVGFIKAAHSALKAQFSPDPTRFAAIEKIWLKKSKEKRASVIKQAEPHVYTHKYHAPRLMYQLDGS
jgi:hypothetical protein